MSALHRRRWLDQSGSRDRFSLLSALSTANEQPEAAAKPFSKNRDGFVMAEGAAALVLERPRTRKSPRRKNSRRDRGLRRASGFVSSHPIEPDGKPIVGCIRSAIADAGLTPDDIDYINPHGTGTSRTTRWSISAYQRCSANAPRASRSRRTSRMVGHTLSAAGAVEAVFTLLTLEHQRLPPTINYNIPDPPSRWMWSQRGAGRQARHAFVQFLRFRRPERLSGAGTEPM